MQLISRTVSYSDLKADVTRRFFLEEACGYRVCYNTDPSLPIELPYITLSSLRSFRYHRVLPGLEGMCELRSHLLANLDGIREFR